MMTTFIARQIEKKAKISLEEGQKLYRAYFINTTLYLSYKADVDTILQTDGYADCIVES